MSMTKDQIRQELINHGVQVPSGNLKKEDYVKLFEEHIKPLNKVTSNFSTDEEDDDQAPVQADKVFELNTVSSPENEAEKKIIADMTDAALYEFLVKAGKNPGPVMSGTRSMYEKLAVKILKEDPNILQKGSEPATNGHENGNDERESNGYSDTDDDDEAIETASKASRASRTSRASSKVASKKLPVAETSVDAGKPSTPTKSSYRQSADTPLASQKGAAVDRRYVSGSDLKNLRVRMDTHGTTSTYRRVTESSQGIKSFSAYKDEVSEPQVLLKKPKQKSSMMYLWIVFILVAAIAGVLFYSYSVNSVEGDEQEKELDDILATLD